MLCTLEDFDEQTKHRFFKYPIAGLVKMNNFLYYVLTHVNTNVTRSVLK